MSALDDLKYTTTVRVTAVKEIQIGVGKTAQERRDFEFTSLLTEEELVSLTMDLEPVSDPIT